VAQTCGLLLLLVGNNYLFRLEASCIFEHALIALPVLWGVVLPDGCVQAGGILNRV
jgi:hypothetical protein